MLEVSSAYDICRWMGYAKAGSFRETTLHVLGVSASAIKLRPFEVITARSTKILVAVECLKAGQKACTADKNGNIGTGNKGKNNFGNNNVGNNNIGAPATPSRWITSSTNTLLPFTSSPYLFPFAFPSLSPSSLASSSLASSLASSSLASCPISSSLASSPITSQPSSSPVSSPISSSVIPTSPRLVSSEVGRPLPPLPLSLPCMLRLPVDVCHTQSEEDRIRHRQGGRRL
ncbi:hypothetical protein ACKKBG_A10330 [Auxenochlorella protothecoides x Auxenochlorella symbiontica]